jgi:hypothetical protein
MRFTFRVCIITPIHIQVVFGWHPRACLHKEVAAVDTESKCPVSGKRKYATEGEALATAAHQIATTNAPKDLRAYRCSWCDSWHLTKDAGREGKNRR